MTPRFAQHILLTAALALLSGQLVISGCAHSNSALSQARENKDFDRAKVLAEINKDPRNATLIAMEAGFARLRQFPKYQRKKDQSDDDNIKDSADNDGVDRDDPARDAAELLERAYASFADLTTPQNMNLAFAADADKPYRGRPHERVLSATSLAILDMVRGRCDLAIPTLRSAEFLDARWQPFPYGTDAPLIYALSLRCNKQVGAAESDLLRARQGLLLSLRLMLGVDPALALLEQIQTVMPRGHAMPVRLAALLMASSLPAVLISDLQAEDPQAIFSAAAQQAEGQLKQLDSLLQNPDLEPILKRVAKLAPQYGDPQWLKAQAKAIIVPELQRIAAAAKALFQAAQDHPNAAVTDLQKALQKAAATGQSIETAVSQPQLLLHLEGQGPSVEREGEYNEIAVIKASATGSSKAELRRLPVTGELPRQCGFFSDGHQGLFVQLCADKTKDAASENAVISDDDNEKLVGLELWSSSYQASSAVGRRFDKILKGRAQFKAGAENVSAVAGWTAWFLFQLTADAFDFCGGSSGDGAYVCYGIALAILALALLSSGIAGGAWLVGSLTNPSADGRYVHQLFESGQIILPEGALP